MSTTRQLAILIFDDAEVLDFCGPFEVFSVANRFTTPAAFEIFTISEKAEPVMARNGLLVNPRYSIRDCPQPDILLVPGGIGTRVLLANTPLLHWIRKTAAEAELVLSVCTGALVLAKAGLLEGLAMTTHHCCYEALREMVPSGIVHEDRRFVDNGRIITSGGISAGIDMSLHVVGRLRGADVARATAKQMVYPWEAP